MGKALKISALVTILALLSITGCGTLHPPVKKKAGNDGLTRRSIEKHPNSYYFFILYHINRQEGDLAGSMSNLKKAQKRDPQSSYLLIEMASLYFQNSQFKEALTVVESVLEKSPDYVDALIFKGRILEELDQVEKAKKAYQRAVSIDPGRESVALRLGELYFDDNDLAEALKVYKGLTLEIPSSYAGHFYLGKVYALQGNNRQAIAAFKRTLQLEPELEEPKFELIELYKANRDHQKAQELFNDLLAQDPDNVRAQFGLAELHLQNNEEKRASEILAALGRRIDDDETILRYLFQQYIDPKEYDRTLLLLKKMLPGAPESSAMHYAFLVVYVNKKSTSLALSQFEKIQPQSSRIYDNAVTHMAYLFQEQELTKEAIAFFDRLIRKIPNKPNYYLYLSSFHEDTKAYSDAVAVLEKGLEVDDNHIKLNFRLGVVFDKMGNKEASIQQMKKVIQIDPNHASALNYLGYTYADLGRNLDEAEQLIKRALTHKPGDGYITDSLGWVYFKKGDYTKALQKLIQAAELVPDDPIILEHLGDAYLMNNDKENALKYYRRSLLKENQKPLSVKEKIRNIEQQRN